MKRYQQILVGSLLALFSAAFSEVTVEIISPPPGEHIEPCQNVTFVADVQTTEGEEINRVNFYNRFKSNISFGYARTAPWETEMEQIKTGNYSITAVARLADNTQIESKPLIFTVGDSTIPEELLHNGSFYDCDSTIEPWYLDLWNAEGTISLVTDTLYGLGDCIRIDPTKPGNQLQFVSISQYANVKKGNTYKLSFSAYAPENKHIAFGILAKQGSTSEKVLFRADTEIEGELLYSKEFTITEDLQSGYSGLLRIGVGDNTNPIYFKWVSLKDITTSTYVDEMPISVNAFKLHQAYPNPFNPATTIAYNLQRRGNVTLMVYNALGKDVAELVKNFQMEGSHSVLFDAQHLPTGIYLYQLQVDGEFSEMKKMVLLK